MDKVLIGVNNLFYTTVCFFLIVTSSLAQKQDVPTIIPKIMADAKSNYSSSPNRDILYKPSNTSEVLTALQLYYSDTVASVRSQAYSLTSSVGQRSLKEQQRKVAAKALLNGCKDKESSIAGICSEALKRFSPKDFDKEARAELGSLISIESYSLKNIVELAGYVNETEYLILLQNLLPDPKLAKRDKWATKLALARMGNEEMLKLVMNKIKKLEVNDDMIYEAGPALKYLRQKESIDYLFEIILSDNKNCESANPNSTGKILCAYRALEFVTPVVQNFPLKLNGSGDLEVKDYTIALETAREWYKANKNSYSLITGIF